MERVGQEPTPVTVQIPAELVRHIDAAVALGAARSRAEYIARAIRRQRDLEADERDLLVLLTERHAHFDDPEEMAALAVWAAKQPLDLD